LTGSSDQVSLTEGSGEAGAVERIREEVSEVPAELAGAAVAVRKDIEGSAAARLGVRAYLWLMDHAPSSTRGKVIAAALVILIVLAPSTALLYWTLTAGADATEDWFSRLGYSGVFLSNLASTATVFIPVPGLTAAAQALIVSTASVLNPLLVGVLGGLGMALGEVTAYVAGMAGSDVAKETDMKGPTRLQPAIDWVIRNVSRLMHRYGVPTLFTLAAVPNPFLFEVAGLTAGATRMGFLKFMAAVTPGKVVRGILLAYVGERLIFG
jgi:membrane protein DedA with SNARE-associated domain